MSPSCVILEQSQIELLVTPGFFLRSQQQKVDLLNGMVTKAMISRFRVSCGLWICCELKGGKQPEQKREGK